MRFAAYIPASDMARGDPDGFLSAYDLFQQGFDTADIARMRWQSEGQVLRAITVERCNRRGLPLPYKGASA